MQFPVFPGIFRQYTEIGLLCHLVDEDDDDSAEDADAGDGEEEERVHEVLVVDVVRHVEAAGGGSGLAVQRWSKMLLLLIDLISSPRIVIFSRLSKDGLLLLILICLSELLFFLDRGPEPQQHQFEYIVALAIFSTLSRRRVRNSTKEHRGWSCCCTCRHGSNLLKCTSKKKVFTKVLQTWAGGG